ncbi:hypothetical protein H0H93_006066 [Arthromyces matolae]|nr:hypothetical protein H0H93_006066 [Arthromyces matolae]
MGILLQVSGSLAAAVLVYGVYQGLRRLSFLIYRELHSSLRDLPGPPNPSWLYGNLAEIWAAENSVLHEKWVREYGPTIQYKGFFSPHSWCRSVDNSDSLIFVSKATELRDVWSTEVAKHDGEGRVDALSWLSRATLDVIGLAGFNYNFDALSKDSEQNELNSAFAIMFKAGTRFTIIPALRAFFPFLRFLKTEQDRKGEEAKATMNRISVELLDDSKKSVDDKAAKRDLLSVLVNSNMATDIPEHQRMTDEDVLAQIPTFLVAGHETTSTGTTWALYALTQDKTIQNKLREELLAVETDNPTMDQLNALPYLDMVVRETLRVHCPVPSTIRISIKDDVVPLGQPITDLKGVVRDSIHISKGQMLFIPILAINRDPSIWGEDAAEFRPERWEHVPDAAASVPGIWGNMLTFLGGPRACIGYRFSLVETKALLFTLVRAFEFDLAVPAKDIIKKSSVVQRPILATDPDGTNQLPLIIRPVVRA